MMHEEERIISLECGCREDKVTGLRTYVCDRHIKMLWPWMKRGEKSLSDLPAELEPKK